MEELSNLNKALYNRLYGCTLRCGRICLKEQGFDDAVYQPGKQAKTE